METEQPRQPGAEGAGNRPIFAGLLIGGASTRMGRDKSLLSYQGRTFTERIIAILNRRARQVVLLGEGTTPVMTTEIQRLPDAPGLAGPIAGIIAALRWQRDACWIIAACDLPLMSDEALDWLLTQRGPDRRAVLPETTEHGVEPLLAIYEPGALELLEQVVAEGRCSPRRIATYPGVHTPAVPEELRSCWTNVNTPDEYRRISTDPGKHNP